MGYDYYNHIPSSAKVKEVRDFLSLLGYQPVERRQSDIDESGWWYYHFKEEDYESFTGITAEIVFSKGSNIVVNLHTKIFCSKYDLEYQTFTCRQLLKRFGGYFVSDEGRGRVIRFEGDERTGAEAGCYRAFSNFGFSITRAKVYLSIRDFKGDQWKEVGKVYEFDVMNPMLLSNNLLVPYLVACAEEYFRATYIALLRYSERKSQIVKSVRLGGDFLIQSFDSSHPLETAIASTLSFQNLSSICSHFKTLDAKLDIAAALRRPFRKRKETLFESIQNLIEHRHSLIHRNDVRTSYTEGNVSRDVANLEAAIKRVYKAITDRYNWIYNDFY